MLTHGSRAVGAVGGGQGQAEASPRPLAGRDRAGGSPTGPLTPELLESHSGMAGGLLGVCDQAVSGSCGSGRAALARGSKPSSALGARCQALAGRCINFSTGGAMLNLRQGVLTSASW